MIGRSWIWTEFKQKEPIFRSALSTSFVRLANKFGCQVGVQSNAGAHGRAERDGLHVFAFGATRLRLQHCTKTGLEVLNDLLVREVDLADTHVNDAGFIRAVFDTGCGLELLHGGSDIVRHRAISLVRSSGAQRLTDLANLGRHFLSRQDDVELQFLVASLDSLDEVLIADHVGAGSLCFLGQVALSQNGDKFGFARAMRKVGDPAHVLIALSGIDAQTNGEVDTLYEFCGCGLFDEFDGAVDIQEGILVNGLCNFEITRRVRVLLNVLSQLFHLWCRRSKSWNSHGMYIRIPHQPPDYRTAISSQNKDMSLNAFAAERRLAIFEELKKGLEPSGEFDTALLAEGKAKGAPQMGATQYKPDRIAFEFIYPDPGSTATVLTVAISPPERIVFMPVPEWVIENIWQGDVTGSFHFISDAERLYAALGSELQVGSNEKWFEPQMAKRRE